MTLAMASKLTNPAWEIAELLLLAAIIIFAPPKADKRYLQAFSSSTKGVCMLTGERFRLTRSVQAIDETQSHNIPSGAIIEILLPENEDGTVTFLWGRLTLNALASDLVGHMAKIRD